MSSKQNLGRRKKRKFYGNRYTAAKTSAAVEPEPQETPPVRRSSSAMKLQEQVSEEPIVDDTLSGYRMFDVDQLTNFIRHNLKYSGYLGDGDSKSFSAVANVDPPVYTDVEIVKLECCGHVQKRMGKRLLDKVAELKSKRFKEGRKSYKGIGGAGGLTKKAIKVIQGHYGGAIRGNVGDLGKMKTAVMAIWKHRGKDHSDCGDWCPAHSGDLGKANKNCLPKFVLDAIKPVFEVLSADGLLAKCTHGGTQNSNESFHHLIWSRCPKTVFVGRKRLETAVFDAAVVYNDSPIWVLRKVIT